MRLPWPSLSPPQIFSRDSNAIGQNAKTQEIRPFPSLKQLTLNRVNLQPQIRQILLQSQSRLYQKLSIVRKQSKVINIANIFFDLKLFFDKMIETIQINISTKLTG